MLGKTNAAVVFSRRELGGSHRRMRPVTFSSPAGLADVHKRRMNPSSHGTAQPFSAAGGSHIEAPAAPSNESLSHDWGWLSPRGPIVMWEPDWPSFIGAHAHSVNDVEES